MATVDVDSLPRWKKVLFSLIPLGIFLLLFEVGLRLTVPFQNVRALCFHPIMERDYCPGVTGSIKYGVVLTVNADGMIDRDYPVPRIPGTLRVAVLGDSFTAGEEVPMGRRFHELWEERLPRRLGRPVEFLNFGVRGFGTWEQLQMFHLKAAKYRPDLTVVNLFWGNDIEDNIGQFKNGAYNPLKEEYPESSLWNRLLIARKNFNKWLWNHLATYQWFRTHYNELEFSIKLLLRKDYREHQERLRRLKEQASPAPGPAPPGKPPPPPAPSRSETAPAPRAVGEQVSLEVKEDLPEIYDDKFFFDSEGWELTRQLILKLKREVEQAGSRLAVIHFVQMDQVHDYPRLPRREFNAFLEQNGIPVFDTFPFYRKLDPETLVATSLWREHQDHHFSEQGHRVYADFTEDFIFRLLQPLAKKQAS